jgi:hypothetical protein
VQRERFNLLAALLKSRRVVEWSIVAAVLIGLVWALEHQVRVVRGQGERVAVRSTLGSLRAALVIDQLMAHARVKDANPGATTVPKNPFTLLQGVPPNYAGELAQRDIFSVPPGSWVFDPECRCIGYRLLYADWLEPEQTAGAIWLRVGGTTDEPRLVPMADYRWMGQRLN